MFKCENHQRSSCFLWICLNCVPVIPFRLMPRNILLFLTAALFFSCQKSVGKFVKLNSDETGITFSNNIFESDSVNIFDFANIYNGGGVGVGDFNNDGL